tara:strand:- start:1500 stop:2345 length:846 start_codon:yes stop_codon:yes gene_type:complete
MPILVDFNQVAISNLMVSLKMNNSNDVEEDMLRHMILNSLRFHRAKFTEEYGELVICCDGRNTWRRDVFPFYKRNRKETRAASGYDWNHIFETLNKIKSEINEHFPYKVVHLDRAEADDVIAVLAKHWTRDEKVLILSGDKDFMQLQKYENVKQYSPVLKKFLRTDNPQEFLFEHIVRGDTADGIPNCLSKDSVFVSGERQSPITKKRLSVWMQKGKVDYKNGDIGFDRNRRLIDFDYIPEDLEKNITKSYEDAPVANRSKLFPYFVSNRLSNLMEHITEF